MLNYKEIVEPITLIDSMARATNGHIDSLSVLLTNEAGSITYHPGLDYTMNYELGMVTPLDNLLAESQSNIISYKYYPLYNSSSMDGEPDNPIFDGMKIFLYDNIVGVNHDSTGWLIGEANYRQEITDSRLYPADFHLIFDGNIGDSVTVDNYNTRSPFYVKNVTHDDYPGFRIFDYDHDDDK